MSIGVSISETCSFTLGCIKEAPSTGAFGRVIGTDLFFHLLTPRMNSKNGQFDMRVTLAGKWSPQTDQVCARVSEYGLMYESGENIVNLADLWHHFVWAHASEYKSLPAGRLKQSALSMTQMTDLPVELARIFNRFV